MYICDRCGYKTERLGNFKTHLMRKIPCKPHKQDIKLSIQFNELFFKDEKKFKCRYCEKNYNQQPNKSRHEKSCINKNCNNIQKAETIYNTKYNTNNNTTIENQFVNNIETQNNVILNFNGFGQETITHIIEDPEFFYKIKELITKYEEVPALLQMYVMLLLDPKNRNLILEKLNSRYIQTHDETGKIINKTKTECYNNIMLRLKEIFIKYLETYSDFKFRHKTIVRTNLIKKRFDIHQDLDSDPDEDYEPYTKNKYCKKNKADYAAYKEEKNKYRLCEKNQDKAEQKEFANEILNGVINIITGVPQLTGKKIPNYVPDMG